MIGYVKCFDSNKTVSFKVIDNKLLKKYNKIWEKVRSLMNIESDSKPAYGDNDKYIKTKLKIYGDKVNTNFHGKIISKEKTACKCLSLILLDSAIRVNRKYYPQTLLEECKYEIKKTKMQNVLMIIQKKVHLIMKLIVTLIMILIMNLTMRQVMNNLLKAKTVF